MVINSQEIDNARDTESVEWQRARSPEQVQERRRAILDAAAELFAESEYREVTLNAIATRAEFTKSNLYRYFSSREEIYLALYLEEVVDWAKRVEQELGGLDEGTSADRLATAIITSLQGSNRLLGLMPLLSVSLERNSSEEALLSFKLELAQVLQRLTAVLARVLPGLDDRQVQVFLTGLHALAAGLWPMSRPNETLQRVLQHPELAGMCVDFRQTLHASVSAMVDGLRKQRAGRLSLNIVRSI